jgi:hypothetical protein
MLSCRKRLTALLVSARHAVYHWDCVRSRRDGDAQPFRAFMRHAALQTWALQTFLWYMSKVGRCVSQHYYFSILIAKHNLAGPVDCQRPWSTARTNRPSTRKPSQSRPTGSPRTSSPATPLPVQAHQTPKSRSLGMRTSGTTTPGAPRKRQRLCNVSTFAS